MKILENYASNLEMNSDFYLIVLIYVLINLLSNVLINSDLSLKRLLLLRSKMDLSQDKNNSKSRSHKHQLIKREVRETKEAIRRKEESNNKIIMMKKRRKEKEKINNKRLVEI